MEIRGNTDFGSNKPTAMVPLAEEVIAILDHEIGTENYYIRLEGFNGRVVLVPEGDGLKEIWRIFEGMFNELQSSQ